MIDTSGNYHARTDLYDVHDYEQDVVQFAARYGAVTRDSIYEPHPGRQQYEGQPYFISEYGGAWWAPGQKKAGDMEKRRRVRRNSGDGIPALPAR